MRLHNLLMVAVLALSTSIAQASTNRVLDTETITTNGATNVLTLPHVTDSFVTNTFTATLTNKTLTAPVITAPSITGNGYIAFGSSQMKFVDSVDLTKNLILNLSGISISSAINLAFSGGNATLTFPAGTGTVATLGATQTFASGSTWNGVTVGTTYGGTGVSNPTTGSIYVGAGASPMTAVAPGTSGNVLTSNGSTWTSAAAAGSAPAITGTRGSPTNVTAAGGIAFTGTNYVNIAFIQGNAGAITVTANPQIAAATNVGQMLTLICRSATNTITIADGTGLSLNGGLVCGLDSILSLVWDGTNWVEISRR